MDSRHNPLSNIPDATTRHLVMQILEWIWCIVFSMWLGSIVVFGVRATVHAILLAGVFVTVGVFETAKRHPVHYSGLGKANGGEYKLKFEAGLSSKVDQWAAHFWLLRLDQHCGACTT